MKAKIAPDAKWEDLGPVFRIASFSAGHGGVILYTRQGFEIFLTAEDVKAYEDRFPTEEEA